MYKNLNISSLGIVGQSEAIELALTHRFKAMDLNLVEFADRVKLRGMPFARRLIESSKIKLSAFALPFELKDDPDKFKEDLARLAEWGSAAAEVGCVRCTMTIEPAGDRLPYHENFTFHSERLAEICSVLLPNNIQLGVGFRAAADLRRNKAFQFIHDLEALSMLVNMVNRPNAGILFNAWDLLASGGSLDTLRNIPVDKIVAVQLADAPEDVPLEELTETSRLLPAVDGRFDIPAVLTALAEMGYEGPVSVTPHRSNFPSSRSDQMAQAISESFNAVWKAANLDPQGNLVEPAEPVESTEV